MRRSPTLLSLFTVLFSRYSAASAIYHAQVEQKPSEIEAPTTAREAALEREVQVIREYDARAEYGLLVPRRRRAHPHPSGRL